MIFELCGFLLSVCLNTSMVFLFYRIHIPVSPADLNITVFGGGLPKFWSTTEVRQMFMKMRDGKMQQITQLQQEIKNLPA